MAQGTNVNVVIIGAGVIGLATAYELRRRGAEVLVLDRAEPGKGASEGNAGWITPSMSGPIPAPGLVGTSMKWMLRNDSPLYIKPRPDIGFARWLFRFWRSCRVGPWDRGFEAVAGLNRRTMELLDAWQADGVRFEMHQEGLIYAALTRTSVEVAIKEVRGIDRFGYARPELLDGDELRKLEPAFSKYVAAGFHVPEERHLRPEQLTAGLVNRLGEMGVEVRSGVEVTGMESTGVERHNGRVTALRTNQGPVKAETVLLATGAWAGQMGRAFGVSLPIEAGKGYSITIEPPPLEVRHPLDFVDKRVAITPFEGALRLAGTMELSGVNLNVLEPRVEAIRRAANRFLGDGEGGGWSNGTRERVWVGMRPLTPDGLPLIGRMPGFSNAWVATGHAMLGVTLAPATGSALAEAMTSGHSEVDLRPFDPARF
jgi:D-amino-acid dehydrogenase